MQELDVMLKLYRMSSSKSSGVWVDTCDIAQSEHFLLRSSQQADYQFFRKIIYQNATLVR